MATEENRFSSQPALPRGESGQLISTPDFAARIENFVQTREGTLKSIEGPLPYVPKNEVSGEYPLTYGNMHGIFHATLRGGATDILLLHTGTSIYRYRGYRPANPWEELVGTSSSAQYQQELTQSTAPQFPTQFEATSTGVVIVPQGGRAMFYDGDTILPLGYATAPSPPIGYGPERKGTIGYSVSRRTGDAYVQHEDFGFGRVGTLGDAVLIDTSAAGTDDFRSRMLAGKYQAAVQWIDYFGNISPLSARSNELHLQEQNSGTAGVTSARPLKHVLWDNIAQGRDGTIGRILSRTHDILNSGTQELFVVTGSTSVTTYGAFATIPDNECAKWPDNVPDAWCVAKPHDIQPTPQFKLCRLAFGRLWVANTKDDPGILIPSMPGRYGTFLTGHEMFPDPSGGEITGLWTVPAGLLIFTATSTFLLTQSNDGKGFRLNNINANIGCVAPSSCANLPDGTAVWLGREGFYAFTPNGVQLISGHLEDIINTPRAKAACAVFDADHKEYRCWVATQASTENDTCFVFDGSNWRRRIHEKLAAVCVTKDHRKYVLGAGVAERESGIAITEQVIEKGVWLLDHSYGQWLAKAPTAVFESNWITWTASQTKRSMKTIYFALRESYQGTATLRVYRDWRITGTPAYEDTDVTLYPVEDAPPFWGITSYDADEWVLRRPYWKRVDISLPACEVFKFVLETDSPIEFLGYGFDEEPKLGGKTTRST